MIKFTKKQLFFLVVFMIPMFAFTQDLVTLKNGKTYYDCKITKEDSVYVYFQFKKNGSILSTYASKDQIESYKYGNLNQSVLSEQPSDNELYQYKINKYSKMRNTGTVLGVGGGILTVVGIVLVSNADWDQQTTSDEYGNTNSNYNTTSGSGIAGVFCIVGGVSIGTVGIIIGTIGSKSVKKYQAKMKNVSFNFNCTPKQQGFVLSYRF